ncbi:MAG: hypothetical protein ICV78_05925 [Tolypothrix sp. Co-bin9]|nr:hypothetical protein [Tolypothrix sp. Co-bin9]
MVQIVVKGVLNLSKTKRYILQCQSNITIESFSISIPKAQNWLQTGKRHYPSYYDRLKKSAACAGFGGFFVPPWPKNAGNLINRVNRAAKQVLIKLNLNKYSCAMG